MYHIEGKTYALLFNYDDALLDELRQRGVCVSRAYLGDLGYTTEEHSESVCDAINDMMADDADWSLIVWDDLSDEAQTRLMLMAADSDSFGEKGRLPSGWGYEDRVREVLGRN